MAQSKFSGSLKGKSPFDFDHFTKIRRTVQTDKEAFKRLSIETGIPVGTITTQYYRALPNAD